MVDIRYAFETLCWLPNASSVTIQITTSMIKILTDVINRDSRPFKLLTGPTRVGKTTTLLWLYKKLMQLDYNVLPIMTDHFKSISENINIETYNVILIDLHNLYSSTVDVNTITSIIQLCITHSVVCVIAASSLSSCLTLLGYRAAGSLYSRIEALSEIYTINPLPHDKALQLARVIHQGKDDDFYDQVVDIACCIPGLICIAAKTKEEISYRIDWAMSNKWTHVANAIMKGNSQINSLLLIILAENHLPYELNELISNIHMEILIRCHVVYIKDDIVHSYYKNLTPLKKSIKADLKTTTVLGGISDERSAVGYCYEYHVLRTLLTLEIVVQCLIPSSTDVKTYSLSLKAIVPMRYNLAQNELSPVQMDVLYLLPKGAYSIDFFSITKINSELCLVITQLTIQQSQNKDKLKNSIDLIPQKIFNIEAIDQQQLLKNVVYIYVNPNNDFSHANGVELLNSHISNYHWLRKKDIVFSFTLPSPTSHALLVEELHKLRASMDPSLRLLNFA